MSSEHFASLRANDGAHLVAEVFHAEYGTCVATLTRLLGDISLAEEAVARPSTLDGLSLGYADDSAPTGGGPLLLSESRRPTRTDADGRLVPLPDQDRGTGR